MYTLGDYDEIILRVLDMQTLGYLDGGIRTFCDLEVSSTDTYPIEDYSVNKYTLTVTSE